MSNGKVALIKLDSYWSNYIPYSLLYLQSSLKEENYDVKIFHNIFSRDTDLDLEQFYKSILKINPILVGFSVITGRSVSLSAKLSKMLKSKNPHLKIVWGGIHPSLLPRETLKNDFIDYVIIDEGEYRILNLLKYIINGSSKHIDMNGICYKVNNEIVIHHVSQKIKDIDKIKINWDDFDLSSYINYDLKLPKLSYITSRGCPYRCRFCYNEALGGTREYRTIGIDHVIEDINYLKDKYKIQAIHFNDDNFFYDRERAFKILEEVNLPWFGEARINYIDEDFCKKVKDSNCLLLMCGGESGSQRILNYIKKGLTIEQLEEATKLIGKYKIRSSWSFMLGLPTETKEEIKQTFKMMVKINSLAGVPICKPGLYIPYPETSLYQDSIKLGFKPPTRIEDWGKMERYNVNDIFLPWVDMEYYKKCLEKYMSLYKKSRLEIYLNRLRRLIQNPHLLKGQITKYKHQYYEKRLFKLVSIKDQEHKNYLELQLNRTLQRKEQNSSDRAKYLLKKLIEKTNCSTELKILSVGCRNKYEIQAIHKTGFNNVTGIDLYSEDKSILVMDMHGMTFEDNSFDIIFSSHSFEHAQDYKKVISEFVRVAKDGSIFVIEVPVNYETTVADLWDFESLGNLKNIFQKHIKQILYEELEKKAENSSSGTDVIRMIFTIAKASVDGENIIGKT